MYCMKCGAQVGDNDAFCMNCGNSLKENKFSSSGRKIFIKKWKKPLFVLVAAVLLFSIGGNLFGTNKKSLIPTYFSAMEKQSYQKLKKVIQKEYFEQVSVGGSPSVRMKLLGDIRYVSYDIGTYTSMSEDECRELENRIWRNYEVSVSVKEGYWVDVYVEFSDSFGDTSRNDERMQIYKSGGRWYVYPQYSGGR